MHIEQIVRSYLPHVIHMSLATCSNNKPWVCEVHYVFDDELNLYFRSTPQRRHSKEIKSQAHVAGNVVEQHVLDQKVRGVYFEGTAKLLEDVDEKHIAYKLYCKRFGTDGKILTEAKKANGHKFYKITVDTFYLFDSRESNPSKKYELKWRGRAKRK